MRISRVIVTSLLVVVVMSLCPTFCAAGQISVLFAMTTKPALTPLPTGMELQLREELKQAGLDVQWDKCDYKDLNPERLSRYNVLVMTYPALLGNNDSVAVYRSKMDTILDYVNSGGGLIIMNDEDYECYKVLNEFLAQLDVEVLPENPVDTSKLYQQPGYLRHYYCSTENVKTHPVSEGIKSLWYPLTHHPDTGNGTYILKLGTEWTEVVCANQSAYYYRTKAREEGKRTYDKPQPILAARELGKGRVIVFATRTLNYFHQPNHPIFEGICLKRGEGFRLVKNMLEWTTELAMKAGNPGGFIMPEQKYEKPKVDPKRLEGLDYYERFELITGNPPKVFPPTYSGPYSDGLKDFVGVIGAHTAYSQAEGDTYLTPGRGTVKEYCDAARKSRFGFVVFTELFENLTEEEWNKLKADCAAESDAGFAAIPGIEVQDSYGDTYIVIDMPRWPDPDWMDKSGKRIVNSPAFYFGLAHKYDHFVGRFLLLPKTAVTYPWETKFYSGFELFSYRRGRELISDAVDYYLRCQANDYNLIPITAQRMWSPFEVYNARGFMTRVRAKDAASIAAQFQYTWYGQRKVYVSSGPELTQWSIEEARWSLREQEWRITVGLKSDSLISSVTIYDRDKVFRRFLPNSKEFHTTLAGYHDKQRFFVLVADDAKGRRLISPALYTSDKRQAQFMCTDLQNTINCSMDITPDGREFYYPGSVGNCDTLWDGIKLKLASPDIIPDSGIEFGYGGWGISCSPYLPGLDGNCWAMAARDVVFSTGDCNVLRNIYDSTLQYNNMPSDVPSVEATSTHIGYTARVGGISTNITRHSVKLLRDFTLPKDRKSEFLRCMGTELQDGAYPNYVIVDETGKKTTGTRSNAMSLDLVLRPGSYFAAFPDLWGSFAVMPITQPLRLRIRGNNIEIGYEITGSLKAGTVISTEALYICGRYGSSDEKDFDHFRKAFGLAGKPVYKCRMTHGKLLSMRYVLDLQASDFGCGGELFPAPLRCDLPINVHGLNSNWDAGFLDIETGKLRRLGVWGDTGILEHNIDLRGVKFACGNLVTCDNADVHLSIFNRGGKWNIEAHNPTGKDVKTRVRIAPWLRKVAPFYDRVKSIPKGSTIIIAL